MKVKLKKTYSGLRDKLGNKLCAADIVKFNDHHDKEFYGDRVKVRRGVIKRRYGCFCVFSLNSSFEPFLLRKNPFESENYVDRGSYIKVR